VDDFVWFEQHLRSSPSFQQLARDTLQAAEDGVRVGQLKENAEYQRRLRAAYERVLKEGKPLPPEGPPLLPGDAPPGTDSASQAQLPPVRVQHTSPSTGGSGQQLPAALQSTTLLWAAPAGGDISRGSSSGGNTPRRTQAGAGARAVPRRSILSACCGKSKTR
jgi:hypothetical protein